MEYHSGAGEESRKTKVLRKKTLSYAIRTPDN